MASTATTRNRLEKQGAGENANTWGAPKLNNLFDQVDASLDGWTIKALTTNGTTASWGQLGATGIADGGISGIKLASGAAVANIGFTPANAAGQAFTGQVSVPAVTHLRAGTRISLYDNTGGLNETTVYFNSLDDTRLAYDVPNGKLSWWVGGVKLFSVDVNGNAIFKGNVTAYGAP